jgi:drug/metabolite transporter (DMT)-like permease
MPQLALLLTTVIWGATFPATKAVLGQIPPFSFLFLRFLLGTLLTLGLVALLDLRPKLDRDLVGKSLVATGWLFLGYGLQTEGLAYTTASNSAFITALYVIFVPLFLRRFHARIWVSAGLAMLGLWLLVDPHMSVNLGDLMTLACAAAFAAHIVCLERYLREADGISLFLWQMMFITAAMLPAMMLESPARLVFAPTGVLLVGLSVTGLFATGAFAVQMWAQSLIPAQRVALIFSLEPVYAAWLSWYFLGERLEPMGWLGSALILAAVVLGSLSHEAVKAETLAKPSPAV